jgi:L-ascorbate metabolism protein UlaG (beta-lactamase superfamily)
MRKIFCITICAALVACGGGEQTSQPGAPHARQVRVDWLGHECFMFQSSLGTKILTNPYETKAAGRTLPSNLRPDIVLISDEQPDANNVNALDNSPAVFRGAVGIGSNNAGGLRIRGIPVYQNPEREDLTEMSLAFVWTLDGVRYCFFGNPEGPLTAAEAMQIGSVDVLLMPVGLPSGLTNSERQVIIAQLHPRVIIPMGRAAEISAWTSGITNVHRLPGSSVLFSRETLPFEQTVVVFASP